MIGDPYHDMAWGDAAAEPAGDEWQQLLCDAPPPLELLREDRRICGVFKGFHWGLEGLEVKLEWTNQGGQRMFEQELPTCFYML